ncbi:hypothetical protein OFO94_35510, partial [Escherichia coli]|nr:hypothetical protein [Escherichia coli]
FVESESTTGLFTDAAQRSARKEVQHHLLWYVDWECCEEDKYTSLDIFATLFIVLSVESSNN